MPRAHFAISHGKGCTLPTTLPHLRAEYKFFLPQVAALAKRMAGRKKGEATQLQIEVGTDEEWGKLLVKEGLIGAA